MTASSEAPEILLRHHLKKLKLPTVLREHEKIARQCAAENVDHVRYLARLIELELLDREARMIDRRIKSAKFPAIKSLESFDFDAIPALNRKLVLDLARGEFVGRRENIIALGPSGVGKTHVALGIGLAACQRGIKTRFSTAAAIVHELIEARDEKRLLRLQKQMATVELLIIDELGFVPLSKTGAELLFELISQRYERGRHDHHIEPAFRRMDCHLRRRTSHWRLARSPDPPRSYPRNECAVLSPRSEQGTQSRLTPNPKILLTEKRARSDSCGQRALNDCRKAALQTG